MYVVNEYRCSDVFNCVPMFGYMFSESRLISVALVAGVTAERLVGHVAAGVRLEIGELGERLATARVLTLVWLFTWRRNHSLYWLPNHSPSADTCMAFNLEKKSFVILDALPQPDC